jgi:hypothetical protein
MINKLFPRKLNRSLDSKLRKPEDMIDAINVVIGDEFSQEGDGANSSVGNVGVLKPVVSNRGISNNTSADQLPVDRIVKIIGSVTDDRIGVIYFFVWCDFAPAQGVYAYDQYGVLPGSEGECVRRVFTHPQFNFPQNGFVKGDVVHTGDGFSFNPTGALGVLSYEAERASIIYFTDNVNEPRKLSVFRAMTVIYGISGDNYNLYDFADFITACPKTPVHPITFEFQSDPSRSVSDFENRNGFQFAYQHIYEDGEESAISVYSDIAVPPAYVQQGTLNNPNLVASNLCVLTIPADVDDSQVRSLEIDKIRILAREGNRGVFYVVDEVDSVLEGVPIRPVDVEYQFYNDRIVSAAPVEDVNKMFDSLPKKAEAQAVVSDRLFYGNYVEGFDNVDVEAEITPVYQEREPDFLSLQVEAIPHVFPTSSLDNAEDIPQRAAGFRIDSSNLPTDISENTNISVEVVMTPDRHLHLYNSENSYHGSQYAFDNGIGLNIPIDKTISESYQSLQFGDSSNSDVPPFFGENFGVVAVSSEDNFPKWYSTQGPVAGTSVDVVYGTSASNPMVIRGGAMTFTCSITTTENIFENTRQRVARAIASALSNPSSFSEDGFVVTSVQNSASYSFNLDIQNGEFISFTGDENKFLINAVADKSEVESNTPTNGITVSSFSGGQDDYNQSLAPCGYFIISKALVTCSLSGNSFVNLQGDGLQYEDDSFVFLKLDSIQVEDNDIRTCIPNVTITSPSSSTNPFLPLFDGWTVYDREFLQENQVPDVDSLQGILFNPNIVTSAQAQIQDLIPSYNQRRRTVGFLQLSGNNLFVNTEERLSRLENIGEDTSNYNGFTLVDGEGGLAWRTGTAFIGCISKSIIFQGSISQSIIQSTGIASDPLDAELSAYDGFPLYTPDTNPLQLFPSFNMLNYTTTDDEVYNEDLLSEIEVFSFQASTVSLSDSNRSFKSAANHDFGIVFFDERGRRSNVNFLDRVYVAGYSGAERGENKGRVAMRFQLLSAPPEWAHNYAIVYAGNSSTDDFIQYSTGGAFVAAESDDDEGNIYVSLNYLQGNTNVSYSKAFGAVSPEGENDLYIFKKGDKLKVISYLEGGDQNKIYPNNYIFDIVDSVDLGDDPDSNPLLGDDVIIDPAKVGRFLVLKNNSTAFGFAYADVLAGGGDSTTDQHKWNNICLVEIYTPSKIQDFEDRPYHEIAFVGNIKRNTITDPSDGSVTEVNKVYSPFDFTIDSGDVWWRRIPLNTPEFGNDPDDGLFKFENLIQDEDSVARFKDFFVESKTFNDTFPGNDVNFIGRPNLVLPNAREIRRRSSVTFSDKNNYATTISRFTSFNASTLNFKDIPNEYGAINYLLNTYDSLFVVQEDKASAIPVSRQILATATGEEQIIASSDILGTQKFFAGDYGTDNNPESVCKIGNNIYFAHKSNHEVYKFNPSNGLRVISDKGMNSFFVELFRAANEAEGKVRVVGGYDPLKDEFLITVFNQETNEVEAIEYVLQPVGVNIILDPVEDDDDGVGIGDDSDEGDGIEDDGGSPGDGTEDTDTGTGSL